VNIVVKFSAPPATINKSISLFNVFEGNNINFENSLVNNNYYPTMIIIIFVIG